MLSDLTFSIRRGAFVGVVGPNGSGKTTLLRALLGLLRPQAGAITFAGGRRPRLGYVPQKNRLDPVFPLRVRDVVMMGRYPEIGPLRRPRAADRAAVAAACEQAGVLPLQDRLYRDLSGGQQQRALIARALAGDPALLVLDEPTNGMDLAAEAAIVDLVRRLNVEGGRTVLFVTHLLNVVTDAATDLLLVHRGKVRIGPRDAMLDPAALTALYGVPIEVFQAGGRRLVLVQRSGS